MPLPYLKRDAIGSIDGVNKIFYTSVSYRPGSISIFLNGLLQAKRSEFSWTENGLNKITLSEAPLSGDEIKIGFIPI